MDEKARKVKRYRDRALGLRKIAESMPPDNTQRQLLSLAIEYERLADLLEQAT